MDPDNPKDAPPRGDIRRRSRIRDLRRIWGGAKRLGMDPDALHSLVEDLTGSKSIAALNAVQRRKVIEDLAAKGAYVYKTNSAARPPARHSDESGMKKRRWRPGGAASDMITNAQQVLIDKLWTDLASVEPNAKSIPWREAFVNRIIGRPWPQKKWEASRVIEALKQRLGQHEKVSSPFLEKGHKNFHGSSEKQDQ